MAESPQELCGQLMQQVGLLSHPSLIKTCDHLGLSSSEDHNPKLLLRRINRYLLSDELEQRDDEGMATYTGLHKFLRAMSTTTGSQTQQPETSNPTLNNAATGAPTANVTSTVTSVPSMTGSTAATSAPQ